MARGGPPVATALPKALLGGESFRKAVSTFAADHHALGTRLSAPDMTEEEALAAGMPAMGASHEWLNVAGQPGCPQYSRDLGIPLTSFEEWAQEHMRAKA